jgi:hypothetical protein
MFETADMAVGGRRRKGVHHFSDFTVPIPPAFDDDGRLIVSARYLLGDAPCAHDPETDRDQEP